MVKADKKLVAWLGLTLTKETCCHQKHISSQERNSEQDLDKPVKLMHTQKIENSVDRQKNCFQLIGDFLTSRLKAGEVLSTDLSQLPLGFVEVHGNRQRRLGSNSQWLLHKVGPRGKL